MHAGPETAAPLHAHVDRLVRAYCGPLVFEYSHLADWQQQEWLQERAEAEAPPLAAEVRRDILRHLSRAGVTLLVWCSCRQDCSTVCSAVMLLSTERWHGKILCSCAEMCACASRHLRFSSSVAYTPGRFAYSKHCARAAVHFTQIFQQNQAPSYTTGLQEPRLLVSAP